MLRGLGKSEAIQSMTWFRVQSTHCDKSRHEQLLQGALVHWRLRDIVTGSVNSMLDMLQALGHLQVLVHCQHLLEKRRTGRFAYFSKISQSQDHSQPVLLV